MDAIVNGEVDFIHPFLSFKSEETLSSSLTEEIGTRFSIPETEIRAAVHNAWLELAACREDMMKKGEETIAFLNETGNRGIVLAGRPYHIDPEVNHGLPELINSYNIAVLTEDSVSHLHQVERPINVMDQWMYHSRLYAAANYVKTTENLDLIQLNSFGCRMRMQLQPSGSRYSESLEPSTPLKGSVRLITLVQHVFVSAPCLPPFVCVNSVEPNARFVLLILPRCHLPKKCVKKYHSLPQMSPIHFSLLEPAFRALVIRLVCFKC